VGALRVLNQSPSLRHAGFFVLGLTLAGCAGDPAPSNPNRDGGGRVTPDSGFFDRDAGHNFLDSGVPRDGGDDGTRDGGDTTRDGGDNGMRDGGDATRDGGDNGMRDGGDAPRDGGDTGMRDGGPAPRDGGPAPRDGGVPLTDGDNDFILDVDEGNGLIDTDNDGTPDTMDPDSDNDGIPDSVEAGDMILTTAPIDTDGDGTPDFQDTDADNDQIPDLTEGTGDPDGDGIPNYLDPDSDNDGISDAVEGAGDPDNDGTPNFLDDDADGDGIPDTIEGQIPTDADFDGTPNFLDLDSDGDTIPDSIEGVVDTDNDGTFDAYDIDSDGDLVLDLAEAGTPAPVDTDNDGVFDFRDLDSDGDTILDTHEGPTSDVDQDGMPDRVDLDSDNDGWTDAQEAGDTDLATLPIDTDGDGLQDFRDLDSDGDSLGDMVEPGCPMGSERLLADTDADTFVDPAEVAYGSNPCDATSVIDDFYFVLPPGGPGDDAPLVFNNTQIDRADLAITMDTTGSMAGEIANLQASLSNTIIPGVNGVIPDAAFGVASFEDFPIAPFGDAPSGDIPFRLGTRVTTNAATSQAAVNGLTTRSGVDFPESGMEALYQVATGAGTSWTGGSVPAFNPAQNNVPNVADGTIGGVGFRQDSLPIVVHVTDAISHTERDYAASASTINAATTTQVQTALSSIGARIVTISSGLRPFNDLLCTGSISSFFGDVAPGTDVDFFELQGAVAGDTVDVEVLANGFLSTLDPLVAVTNATALIATNDDAAANTTDAALAGVTLTGAGPYYVAITSTGDTNFDGVGGTTAGHYVANVALNSASFMASPTECRADDGDARMTATVLVPVASAVPPVNVAQCLANCDATLGAVSPLFAEFTFPYEMSEDTGAVIPPCSWSEFGTARPTGCAANECCTGEAGAGVPPNAAGQCPLAFEIDPTGAGIDTAMISGIQALVQFSPFTITTQVREDPVELANSGIDTRCFIQSVVPVSATPPNACVPQPTIADLFPPAGQPDAWENVVPGTVLAFQVNALNQDATGPCAPAAAAPQQFSAFIDVVADGVTVVDTRDVIIIVPAAPPGGQN
jgi:hypothetical protein